MIEKGELDRCDAVLVEDAPLTPPYDGEDAVRLYALAELRRAQGRAEEAYEVAVAAGETAEAALPYLGYCPWRCSAAQSALALGHRDRALELVRQELERLETTQILHERIRALRLAGICEGGEQGLATLREAVELGEAHPPRLETIHALIALGAALRRAKQGGAARGPLERTLDLARRGGASVLRELARTELVASGARPRRDALSGPESLTASEHRIAELAATGQSNREIAAALFVTPKTVEYHLRNCYRKLDIETRRELANALEA
jgi:DNA-binding CsgD family transcriptional regulator